MPADIEPGDQAEPLNLHASFVAVGDAGLLIAGPSGSGKSALALQMMALGAEFVSDDRTLVTREGDQLIGRPPEQISGRIEARGLGILKTPRRQRARVQAVLDLSETETDRMPQVRSKVLLGVDLTLLYRIDAPHAPAALVTYLRHGRLE